MGKSKGGAAPDSTCEEEEHVLKDMARLIKEYHDPSRWGHNCQSLLYLCFPALVELAACKPYKGCHAFPCLSVLTNHIESAGH